MSRPRWSVPSQWAALGGASVAAASVEMGSYVWSWLAKTAVNAITTMMTPPAAPSGFLRQKARSPDHIPALREGTAGTGTAMAPAPLGAIAHPRVEHPVEHVHGQVRENHDRGDEHDEALHDRIVAPQDGLDEEARDARQVEHGLRDDEAADQERELDADDGHDGQNRVLERVVPDHHPLPLPLGPRRPDVVLPHHFQ